QAQRVAHVQRAVGHVHPAAGTDAAVARGPYVDEVGSAASPAEGRIVGQGGASDGGAAAGFVQAAAEAATAVAAPSRRGLTPAASAALTAEGLIPLEDGAALQRHRTAGPDAAASGVGAGLAIVALAILQF